MTDWTPVDQYPDLIMERSKLRGWGFTVADVDKLAAKLHDHNGLFTPTGVKIWLGRDLTFNWLEATAWLSDVLKSFQIYAIEPDNLTLLSGDVRRSRRQLSVVDLDFYTFWNPPDNKTPRDIRSTRSNWPGLEVAWFSALNPQIYELMDDKKIPYLFAPGLVVNPACIPSFEYNKTVKTACVNDHWDHTIRTDFTMVAFV